MYKNTTAAAEMALQLKLSLSLLHFMRFQNNTFLRGDISPTPNPQPGGPGYPFFVWVITFDLSGMGDPASSYAATSTALRIM
jgi:hypothetical protein